MNSLLRLLWALPLVLAIGAAAMLVLRRLLASAMPPRGASRVAVRETLALSDHTRVHLLEIDGSGFLVVESTQSATLQPMAARVREPAGGPGRSRPRWLGELGAAR
jgi:flagellar biogenesis protein FliO